MKTTLSCISACALFTAVFSYLTAGELVFTVAGENTWENLPLELLFRAFVALILAAVFYFIFEGIRKKFKGAGEKASEYKGGYFVVGAILTSASFGAYIGFQVSSSTITRARAEVEAEKLRVAKKEEDQENSKRERTKQREAELQRVETLTPAQQAAEAKVALEKAKGFRVDERLEAKLRKSDPAVLSMFPAKGFKDGAAGFLKRYSLYVIPDSE